jgi:hypothetical protein
MKSMYNFQCKAFAINELWFYVSNYWGGLRQRFTNVPRLCKSADSIA